MKLITSQSLGGVFAGALAAAIAVGISDERDTALAREIARNEQICQIEKRPGYMVYVVTRHGELRGCIRVQEEARDGIRPAPILIVKQAGM